MQAGRDPGRRLGRVTYEVTEEIVQTYCLPRRPPGTLRVIDLLSLVAGEQTSDMPWPGLPY